VCVCVYACVHSVCMCVCICLCALVWLFNYNQTKKQNHMTWVCIPHGDTVTTAMLYLCY